MAHVFEAAAYEHGGDWVGFQRQWGHDPLDFSVSVSPLGVPSGVADALAHAATRLDRYPDPWCRQLRYALAAKIDVDPGWVLCGAGAADLIFRSVYAAKPHRALITSPTFGAYEQALRAVGADIVYHPLDEGRGFSLGREVLDRLASGGENSIDMLFLCEPNNPTGVLTDRDLLFDILAVCAERHIRLIVDESFIDFVVTPETTTIATELALCQQLVVLRSFTKLFGMAGLRLGFVLSSDVDFLAAMQMAGPWWNVSLPAQEAGIAALREEDYVKRVRTLVACERPRLASALGELGFRVIDGRANYLLFQSDVPLAPLLAKRGILIRSCGSFAGLDDGWYRVAVRTRADNERLIAALRAIGSREVNRGSGMGNRRGM